MARRRTKVIQEEEQQVVSCLHLNEDGVIFDVAAGFQDALGHKERTAGGYVHLGCRTPEAAAVWIRLKGIA